MKHTTSPEGKQIMAAEMPKDEKEAAQTQPQGEEYAQHVAHHHMQQRRKKETE